jgi:hypothetical protein
MEAGLRTLRQVRDDRRRPAVLAPQTRAVAFAGRTRTTDEMADWLHEQFEPTARAIAGLERALAGLGLLDDALALDLRRPQDYLHRLWAVGFRTSGLAIVADLEHTHDHPRDGSPADAGGQPSPPAGHPGQAGPNRGPPHDAPRTHRDHLSRGRSPTRSNSRFLDKRLADLEAELPDERSHDRATQPPHA